MRIIVLSLATLGLGCGASHDVAVDSATPDTPADTAPDAAWVSAWDAPTGASLDGVTLADGWTDLRQLSSPLEISGGWTDSLFAMQGGRRLLLAYEQTDFFAALQGHKSTTGPPLAGISPATFKIFEADLGATDWSVSVHPVDSPDPSVVEASPATNANGDLLVFTEFTLPNGRSELYYARDLADAWTVPATIPINSVSCNDDNAKIVGEYDTGVTIYFESTRDTDDGSGTACAPHPKLYTSTFAGGMFTPVVPVPGISDAGSQDSQPFITLDQNTLYWTGSRDGSYGIFTAMRNGDAFGAIHPIAIPTTAPPVSDKVVFIGEASVIDVPEGELLYMMCGVAMNQHDAMTYFDADYIQLEPCVARRPH